MTTASPATGRVVFIDTETTSLDADTGEIWEVAAVWGTSMGSGDFFSRRWLLPVSLESADPESLAIGRFHERHPQGSNFNSIEQCALVDAFLREFADITAGAHLAGMVTSFDEERLRRLYVSAGRSALMKWHYHLVEVENLVAGAMQIPPPWNSTKLSQAVHVEPPPETERHTALGDAIWARRIYMAVMQSR